MQLHCHPSIEAVKELLSRYHLLQELPLGTVKSLQVGLMNWLRIHNYLLHWCQFSMFSHLSYAR